MSVYPRILAYLKPHFWVFLTAAVATLLFAALDAFSFVLLIPFVGTLFGQGSADGGRVAQLIEGTVGRFVDLHGDPLVAVQGVIVVILVVFGLKNLFDFIRAYLMARVDHGVSRDLRDTVYDHLLELDLAFFGRTRVGQITSRLTHDVERLRSLITREGAKFVKSAFELVAAVYFMLFISWQLTLAAFVVVPGAMIIWGPLVKRLRRGDRRVMNMAGEVNSHIQETLSGIRLVKSTASEDHERRRFFALTQAYFATSVRTERLRALAAPLTEMLAALGTVVLLWFGARLVLLDGSMTGALFIGFLALSMKLYAPVKYMSKFPALVQPGLVGAERVFEFLDSPVEIQDRAGARTLDTVEKEIRYEDVSFAYRYGDDVLTGIDLAVPVGSVIALVGPSGAGKTTLVDLLGRFFEVTSGRITIDGVDIRDFTIRSLRGMLGIVSQDTVLFHDTIRANIVYGLDDVPEEDLVAAAEAANAQPFIERLPEKYDTLVGERGTALSGGERQRIAIARALLRDAPILILDEATSALDTESERLVQAAIEQLLSGRTVFVIAHRLSTVQRADRIVVVDAGRIVEQGSHEELLSRGGLYRKLYELQFADDVAPASSTGEPEGC